MFQRHMLLAILGTVAATAGHAAPAEPLLPGDPVECREVIFNPGKWEERGHSTRLVPWTGRHVVLLTTNATLDPEVMGRFVARLDGAWKLYTELTGRSPARFKQLDGKPTIVAVPEGRLTCGYGCGYIGSTGIEIAGFYGHDYPLVSRQAEAFPHYYFYEMGRNFYTFGDRHSLFITGFAVFMRYVCMDALRCADPDAATRRTIEEAEAIYAKSDLDFLKAFTAVAGLGEKAPRLKRPDGQAIHPSDQPVIYASAMLKLRRDCGGDTWLKRFFAELSRCPKIKPDTREAALEQCRNWLVAAACAADRDLTGLFVDRWRLPLPKAEREKLAQIRWDAPDLSAATVLQQLSATPTDSSAAPTAAGGTP